MKKIIIIALFLLLAGRLYEAALNLFTKKCHGQFGVEFNSKRRQLNMPGIPVNWQVKHTDEIETLWVGNKSLIGH